MRRTKPFAAASHQLACQVFYRRKLGGSAILAGAAFGTSKDHIQWGRFTRDWMLENQLNQTSFKATRAKAAAHQIEEAGARPRAMVPWIGANKLVDLEKN